MHSSTSPNAIWSKSLILVDLGRFFVLFGGAITQNVHFAFETINHLAHKNEAVVHCPPHKQKVRRTMNEIETKERIRKSRKKQKQFEYSAGSKTAQVH